MQDRPALGRNRDQRWSQAPATDGSMSRLEVMLAAEFRVVHKELADIRAEMAARRPPRPPAPAPAKPGPRRSLGRGLDALIGAPTVGWWHEGIFPDPSSRPVSDDRGK